MRKLPLLLSLLVCAACGGTPTLELVVPQTSVAGDGATPVNVQVKLTKSGSPTEGVVHVTISDGRFKDPSGGDARVIEANPTDGVATVYVIPPRRGRGTIDIVATSAVDGTALKKTAQVALTPAGGLASDLSFTCEKQNVGAFVTGRSQPIHVLCTAVATDGNKHPIPNASIETMAEAGRLEWVTNDATGAQQLVYTIDPGAPPPKDVDPLDASGKPSTCSSVCQSDPGGSGCVEPCWVEGNVIHNPRDGLATLLVAVPGAKAYDDRGEPYVDMDDNGQRDSGEAFIDYNGNGKWDPPDGTQKERMIWRALRIVWSGEADVSATAHGSKIVAPSGGGKAQTLSLHLTDRNYNTLAADGQAGSDAIAIASTSCTNGGTVTLPAGVSMEQVRPGIKLLADTGQSPAPGTAPGGIDGPTFASSYRVGSDYSFQASIDTAPDTCSLTATVSRDFDPGAPGFESSGSLSTETVTGSVSFH